MVWRNRHRARCKKRAKLEKLRKASGIPNADYYYMDTDRAIISPQAHQLKRAHLRQISRLPRRPCKTLSPTSQPIVPLAILQTFPWILFWILFSSCSPILNDFQNSEFSVPSYSPIPPEDNTFYDEIYQSLEHPIESIRRSSPPF